MGLYRVWGLGSKLLKGGYKGGYIEFRVKRVYNIIEDYIGDYQKGY